ncbi:MAG: helix-turn-helix transcriptional regulator [Desulfobacterales bacterium]|nr:helix-turn-helix transcriptional regulator [Desulfobacterales bacterium]
MKFQVVLGRKIKSLRTIHGFSQVKLAKLLGYESTGTISQIETGQRGMDHDKICLAAKIFNVDEAELFSTQEYRPEELTMLIRFRQMLAVPVKERSAYYHSIKALLEISDDEGFGPLRAVPDPTKDEAVP